MNTLINPRWLFAVHTFPLLVFSWLAYRQYTLIESLLEPEYKAFWLTFAIITGFFLAGVLGAGVWLDTVRKRVPVALLAGLFITTVGYLYFGINHLSQLVPWNIPRWLGGEDLALYFLTFGMPTLGYCLLGAVHYATPDAEQRKIWPNFVAAFVIPLAVYLVSMIGIPLFSGMSSGFMEHILVVLFITLTVAFLFFLVRGLYLLAIRREKAFRERRIWWMIPLAIVFPLLGLLVNSGSLKPGGPGFAGSNVFGDFSHPLFYLIAGFNGLLLCLPDYDNKLYRLFLFLAKSTTTAFIAYFFVVFLPFLPLSIPAILVFGLGFLMLTPLLLFPVQLTSLRDDFRFLNRYFDRRFLSLSGVVFFLFLPLTITLNYQRDKSTLDTALNYVYAPAEAGQKQVDAKSLTRVLRSIDEQKGRRNDFRFGSGTPYLSSYYRWLVLDNLTLSDAKINDLRRIFLGESGWENQGVSRIPVGKVSLTNTTVETTWDPQQEVWSSWVELELTADSTLGLQEYHTEFRLPPGVFIADYYLYVGDRKEFGILAERKAATWIYNNIVNENRDPGLLRYKTADVVCFNVFPFQAGEVRRTGMRFLHREPLTLPFAGTSLVLGRVGEHQVGGTQSGATIYVSQSEKAALTQVQGKVGVQFVVDASRQSRETEADLVARIKAFAAGLPASSPQPRITLAGTYPQHLAYNDDWESALTKMPTGGFFARRAMEEILATVPETSPAPTFWKIIVVPNQWNRPVLDGDFSAWAHALPAGNDFYYLSEKGTLARHSLVEEPARQQQDSVTLPAVVSAYAYPNADAPTHWLPVNNEPAILLQLGAAPLAANGLPAKTWAAGLALYGQYLHHQRTGQTGYRPWLAEVRGSFRAALLMPTTAFLVVENDAQKEALRRKQAETLDADPALDLEEADIRSMSEPGLFWGMAILLLLLGWQRRKLSF
ncbi:MSEP-CTERM sorting domain-containing protein [Neolewinella lacunae]|uniref:MSEP-CTERM sorting domain-containing protein n=1 Tax=Neolewinella lacunae TaxID=1517758 RepID=A0A923PRH0_9BACT|nr:MSEP-CTERM sorting domain-containing protein [Neolewinella lacunae]MBC6996123.1 MSEP-CTERM sorting domain-containing protein [Neolewinella lacunae]MDN3633976.1 MSEP-CTERM sorting domain-containing protein [Neolewinella lacunae]